jgi:ubiquinone/menaquinone biosynthesis C-methylase UbiE
VEHNEAIGLISAAVTKDAGTWADLGAGAGTFTRALASLLGANATVYAVDRDARALRQIAESHVDGRAQIRTMTGDFTGRLELPPLDGVVIANALHYVPYADQARVLGQVAQLTAEAAPIVVVEYERRNANPWVPYPITIAHLGDIAREAGLGMPTPLANRPSRFSGTIYSAIVRHR